MAELDRYVPMIDAILSVSDPEEVSAKRIRKALQELFAVDLSVHKHDLKDLIVSRFNRLQDLQSKTLKHEELIDLDSKLAAKLQSEEVSSLKRHRSGKKEKKVKGKKEKKKKRKTSNENPNSIHVKNVGLSPALQKFLNAEQMPRTQVVKAVWDYIKANDLQNPEDRREIICNDEMRPIFGDKMTMFSMNKILSKHLYKLQGTSEDPSETPGANDSLNGPESSLETDHDEDGKKNIDIAK